MSAYSVRVIARRYANSSESLVAVLDPNGHEVTRMVGKKRAEAYARRLTRQARP